MIIPVGTILVYGKYDSVSNLFSNINHLAIMLDNNKVLHMTSKGIKVHDYLKLASKNIWYLLGYVVIKNVDLRMKLLGVSRAIVANLKNNITFINVSCVHQIHNLVFGSCIVNDQTQQVQQKNKQQLRKFSTNFITQENEEMHMVCSSFVFYVLMYAVSLIPSLNNIMKRMQAKKCKPVDVQKLVKTFPSIFEYVQVYTSSVDPYHP